MKKLLPSKRPRYHFVLPLQDNDVQVEASAHAHLDLLKTRVLQDKSIKIMEGMALATCEDYRKMAQTQTPVREVSNDYRRFCDLFVQAYQETLIACIAHYREDPEIFVQDCASLSSSGYLPTYQQLIQHYRAIRTTAS